MNDALETLKVISDRANRAANGGLSRAGHHAGITDYKRELRVIRALADLAIEKVEPANENGEGM